MRTSIKTISAATFLLLFALMAQLTVNGQATEAQIQRAVDSIGKAVSAKRILFKPNWIYTETSGFKIDSTLGYYVKISGETVEVFLPTYNPQTQRGYILGPAATINTTNNVKFEYSKCQIKIILMKNQWIYTISFADKGDRVDVNFFPDGRTAVTVMRAYKGFSYSGKSYLL